jgi:hypothetical protein
MLRIDPIGKSGITGRLYIDFSNARYKERKHVEKVVLTCLREQCIPEMTSIIMDYLWLTACDLKHETRMDLFVEEYGWIEACNLQQQHFVDSCPFTVSQRAGTTLTKAIAIPAHYSCVPSINKHEWVEHNAYVVRTSANPKDLQQYAKHNTYILRPDYVAHTPEKWLEISRNCELYVYDTTMKCIPASILQYRDNHFLITYQGCSSVWNEWIPCDSYRFCHFPLPTSMRPAFFIDLLWWRSVLGNAMTCHHVFQHVSAYFLYERGYYYASDFKHINKVIQYLANKFKDHSCQKDIIV